MVEVPATALRAARFAEEVDFFSVGTNDLTQYTLAAERGNPQVARLADAFQPAVLQLIQMVVEAAHARGKWVGVCGELASDPLAVPLLVGLGIDELSMNPPAIPRAKQIIRELDYASARALATAAVERDTPEAVRECVRQHA
jgi:phosphoenolpyruvate-protein kinase (PTS system EI component)